MNFLNKKGVKFLLTAFNKRNECYLELLKEKVEDPLNKYVLNIDYELIMADNSPYVGMARVGQTYVA